MSDKSSIEWTDATWNPVRGCTKVSAGCKNCYAETFAERWRGVPGHAFEQGFDLRLVPEALAKPLGWKRPRKIFVNSMSDLFHEDVTDEYIAAVFGVMAATPHHTYQVLTKRAERLPRWFEWVDKRGDDGLSMFPDDPADWRVRQMLNVTARRQGADVGANHGGPWPLPNVWIGVSTEDQATADKRIPHLLATPAATRFVSAEPLLGPVRIDDISDGAGGVIKPLVGLHWVPTARGMELRPAVKGPTIDWVIVGGESGPGARPMDVGWARSIVAQCRAARVPCFVKQLGARPWDNNNGRCAADGSVISTAELRLKSRKGGDMNEWPEDLRVRGFPAASPTPATEETP